jgi:hypothetical protein
MMERKRISTIETFSIVALSVAAAAVITKLVSFVLSATCASPKLDSPLFSTTSPVFLPTKIFEIKI